MKKIFCFELIFFLLTQVFGVLMARRIFINFPQEITKASGVEFPWIGFFLSFFILVFLILFVLKFKKVKNVFFRIIFLLIIFLGVEMFLETWLPFFVALFLTLSLLFLWLQFARVWFHNILLILGMAGLGGLTGLSFSPMTVIVLFLVFSVYDFIAVYLTGHMVEMAKGMTESGAVLGFVVPKNINDFKKRMKEIKMGGGERKFSLLGTGDVFFPLLLAVSFIPFGLDKSFVIIFFSCLGLVFSFWLFQELDKRPMPALPPIFLFSLLGFIINQLI